MPAPSVLILGGGPSGMAASFELARSSAPVTLIERAPQIGGLAKTLQFETPEGVFRTDIGPHRFFSKNAYLYALIGDLLKEHWNLIPRHTQFFIGGKYYTYPARLKNILRQMEKMRIFRMITDYGYERMRSYVWPRTIRTFEDHALATFGRTLAEFNILNYTEKIWGIPCREISVDWASQRIAGLNVRATLKAMFSSKTTAKSLVDSFYYPAHGSGLIYETMRQHLETYGGTVRTSSRPTRFALAGNRITDVEVETPEGLHTVKPDTVVCSIPITETVRLFGDAAPAAVREAAKALRFRAQVYLFLTIARERVTQDNWVYFPDKEIPFGRISEMKNFSLLMAPSNMTSLFLEFFCFEGDEIWQMSQERLTALATEWLEKLGIVSRKDVRSAFMLKQEHVYPLYDLAYRAHASTILGWLDGLENFYAIGRPGRFRYTNQDHSLEMGILAARSILEGKRYDMDTVANSREYFERGYVPTPQDNE